MKLFTKEAWGNFRNERSICARQIKKYVITLLLSIVFPASVTYAEGIDYFRQPSYRNIGFSVNLTF